MWLSKQWYYGMIGHASLASFDMQYNSKNSTAVDDAIEKNERSNVDGDYLKSCICYWIQYDAYFLNKY